jgi:phosphatidylglycerol:prolipoprotein diacylglycerol transferase
VLWVTLGIILGGRLGYVLFYNPGYFAAHPLESLQLWKGGMSFHGGFLGCVLAVVLFARHRGLSILSLGDLTCAAGTIGIFLGRIANFINGELWGRPTDVPWAMVFPTGGPLPRHPSQLYEAALEGLVLFVVLTALIRAGALKRPGFILGAFAFGYGVARAICEQFREPDPQLGFLWGGLTMGTLLSLPMMLAGLAIMWAACDRSRRGGRDGEPSAPLEVEIPPAHRGQRSDRGGAVYGAVPDPSRARLLHHAGSVRRARRFHHRAGDQPDVRRAGRACGRPPCGAMGSPEPSTWWSSARSRHHDDDVLRVAKGDAGLPRRHRPAHDRNQPGLERLQRQALSAADVPVSWHRSIEDVPDGPLIVLANEFFDALPIHQAVMCADGWHQRVIKIGEDDAFQFGTERDPIPLFDKLLPRNLGRRKIGDIFEWRADNIALEIGRRVVRFGGAALIIDYGHVESAIGDTLQAVGRHTSPIRC